MIIMSRPCWICGINHGTVKYITERRQIEWVCTGCENKENEVDMDESRSNK